MSTVISVHWDGNETSLRRVLLGGDLMGYLGEPVVLPSPEKKDNRKPRAVLASAFRPLRRRLTVTFPDIYARHPRPPAPLAAAPEPAAARTVSAPVRRRAAPRALRTALEQLSPRLCQRSVVSIATG